MLLIKPHTKKVKINLSKDNEQTVVVDMTGLEDKVANAVTKAFSGMEERLTAAPSMKSANEVATPVKVPFNYKKGLAKMIVDDRGGTSASQPIHEGLYSSEEIPDYISKDDKGNYYITETPSLVEAIGSFDPDCNIPQVWADDIQLTHVYGKSIFWGAWFMNWNQGIYQKPGDQVNWTKIPPMVAATLACTEPTTTAPTMECPYCALTGRVCALYICVDDIEDALTGLVDAVNEAIGNCLSVAIDEYFINVALSCTNLGTLADTGPMTGSLLIEAMGTMQMANQNKWKPLYSGAHIYLPICAHLENPKKLSALNVDTQEYPIQLKDKHSAPNVEYILYSTEKETLTTENSGNKTTPTNTKTKREAEIKLTPWSTLNSGKKEETYVTYVNNLMIAPEHWSFMSEMEKHIDATPHSLDNILSGLSYSVKDVTTQPIGGLTDLIGNMTCLNNMSFHFSEPNLPSSKAGM